MKIDCRSRAIAACAFVLLLGIPEIAGAGEPGRRPNRDDDFGLLFIDRDNGSKGDRKGDGEDSTRDKSQRSFEGGWRVRIMNGYYELFDPGGHLVISRKARKSDFRKF